MGDRTFVARADAVEATGWAGLDDAAIAKIKKERGFARQLVASFEAQFGFALREMGELGQGQARAPDQTAQIRKYFDDRTLVARVDATEAAHWVGLDLNAIASLEEERELAKQLIARFEARFGFGLQQPAHNNLSDESRAPGFRQTAMNDLIPAAPTAPAQQPTTTGGGFGAAHGAPSVGTAASRSGSSASTRGGSSQRGGAFGVGGRGNGRSVMGGGREGRGQVQNSESGLDDVEVEMEF